MKRRSALHRPFRVLWLVHLVFFGLMASLLFVVQRSDQTGSSESDFWAGRMVASLAAGFGLLVSIITLVLLGRWSNRVRAILEVAQGFLHGRWKARAEVAGPEEIALLARCTNEIGDRLLHQDGQSGRQRWMFETLLDQLSEGVLVSGHDGRILLANRAAVQLLQLASPRPDGAFEGLMVERCISQHDVLALLHPPDPSEDEGMPGPSGGLKQADGTTLEEITIHEDRPEGPLLLLARACSIDLPRNALGMEPAQIEKGRLVMLADISEPARAMQVKADFAANASHELRTPLAAIMAAVETVRAPEVGADPGAVRRWIEVIDRKSRQMHALVTDLLDLSRLESPRGRFEPGRLATRGLIDGLHHEFADAISRKALHWTVEVAPGLEELTANPDLLRVALRNLIENAIEFTDTQGRITVTVRWDGARPAIDVADNGCGISAEDQQRVFERFYQVGRSRSGENRGTGLGLSIVRHAVAAMKGDVQLHSALGAGTKVTIQLPPTRN
jgi:signal transduction histidine kinase